MFPCPKWLMMKLTLSDRKIPLWARLLFPTLHFCWEWDGLAIDKFCPEFDCCTCLKKKP